MRSSLQTQLLKASELVCRRTCVRLKKEEIYWQVGGWLDFWLASCKSSLAGARAHGLPWLHAACGAHVRASEATCQPEIECVANLPIQFFRLDVQASWCALFWSMRAAVFHAPRMRMHAARNSCNLPIRNRMNHQLANKITHARIRASPHAHACLFGSVLHKDEGRKSNPSGELCSTKGSYFEVTFFSLCTYYSAKTCFNVWRTSSYIFLINWITH